MSREQFIKKNINFWWHVKNPLQLDEEAIIEGVVKYGDMKEIRQLMKIIGSQKVAKIFAKQVGNKRTNYDAKTINYFKQYFKQYAK